MCGGSGLGEAVARELARHGEKMAVVDVNADNARRVVRKDGQAAPLEDFERVVRVNLMVDSRKMRGNFSASATLCSWHSKGACCA